MREGDAFAALTGLDNARAQAAVMRLGDQTLELVQFETPGRPYPEPRAANDPWFQHFAIAVGDMDLAFASFRGSARRVFPAADPAPSPQHRRRDRL